MILWGLFGFLALQAGVSTILDHVRPYWRDPVWDHKAACLRRQLRAAPECSCSVVMLGCSRVVFGFDAGLIEPALSEAARRQVRVFNCGIYGAGPFRSLLHYLRLRSQGIRPDLLLIEVMPAFLAGQHPYEDCSIHHLPTAQLARSDLSLVRRYGGTEREHVRGEWRETLLAPCYWQRFALLAPTVPVFLSYDVRRAHLPYGDSRGFAVLPGIEHGQTDAQQQVQFAQEHALYQGYLDQFVLGGPGVEALRELLARCRSDGVAAALVLMPEGPAFRSWYPPQTLEQIQTFLGGLQHDFGVPVVDARTWLMEEDFRDSHHMWKSGAARFTRRLCTEFLIPHLARSQSATDRPR
jgi:hypothetical protein